MLTDQTTQTDSANAQISAIQPLFRADIEGLRGVAILLVVAYHAGIPGFSGGYIGVDVFFVLSGYLITWLVVQEIERTGRLNLMQFYARRARRLLPAAAVVLLVTALCAALVYSPVEQRELAKSALTTAAYASNLWFARAATDYLAADIASNPLLHTWSLSVEEQFYFVWPTLLLLAFGLYRAGNGGVAAGRRTAIWTIAVLALISLLLCVGLTQVRQPWAFFSSPARAWEFCLGGLGLLLFVPLRPVWNTVLGWLGFAAIVGSAVLLQRTTLFPGIVAAIPVLGTVLVLRAGTTDSPYGPAKFLASPFLRPFGRLSYSWYLWHWPVLVLVVATIGPLSLTGRLACLAASLLLAQFCYRYVEHPVRHSQLLVRRPATAVWMAVAITAWGVGGALMWRSLLADEAQSPAQIRFTAAKGDLPRTWPECMPGFFTIDVKECTFGDAKARRTVVLFGDSHAAQWIPALEKFALEGNWRVLTLLKAACPAANVQFVYSEVRRRYVECETWRDLALQRIREIAPDAVIVASAQAYAWPSAAPSVSAEAWLNGTRHTLELLDQLGVPVVHLRDTPAPGFNVPDCLARAAWREHWHRRSSCGFPRSGGMSNEVRVLEQRAGEGLKNVRYADLTEYICPGVQCNVERGETVMYADTNHLTASFTRMLAPALAQFLQHALVRP
jgi:peptidoglycan/LPS O-acetylase OafA/YrhL